MRSVAGHWIAGRIVLFFLLCITPLYAQTGAIITGTPSVANLCNPDFFEVPYTAISDFDKTNQFLAQLSDTLGNFVSFTNIGAVSSRESGAIKAAIPKSARRRVQYRVRVVSTSPYKLGKPSDATITHTQSQPLQQSPLVHSPLRRPYSRCSYLSEPVEYLLVLSDDRNLVPIHCIL